MNDLMSLGLHRAWKFYTVMVADLKAGHRVLDIAGGTGDLASAFAEKVGPSGLVVHTDINEAMLRVGRDRLINRGQVLPTLVCDAETLPFADQSFDRVSVAFGLRNMTHKDAALREMARVLKPGGILWQMELPPMNAMPNYENFYMNWDTSYNNEPYYGTFRKQDYRQLLLDAGFSADDFIEATMPRYTFVGEAAFQEAIQGTNTFDTLTGRMDPKGTRWYGFGAWKR